MVTASFGDPFAHRCLLTQKNCMHYNASHSFGALFGATTHCRYHLATRSHLSSNTLNDSYFLVSPLQEPISLFLILSTLFRDNHGQRPRAHNHFQGL